MEEETMKRNVMVILVLILIFAFPLDIAVFMNNILGWRTHILLYIGFVIFMLFITPGKTIKQKWNNLLDKVRVNGK